MRTTTPARAARDRPGARGRLRSQGSALLRPAIGPWLAVHAVAVSSLVLVAVVADGELERTGSAPGAAGWWSWDASWYRSIADDGYVRPDERDVRFFPLLPLVGRLFGLAPGLSAGVAMALVASLASLVFLALLARLGTELLGSPQSGRQVAWLGALVPGATVLVLPYTEALAGALAVTFFLALRRDAWVVVAIAGVASGLARPTGVLLALVAAVWLVTERPSKSALVGVVAPVVGLGLYLLWSALTFGDPMLPLSAQSDPDLRGGLLVNPIPGVLADDAGGITWPVTFALMAVAVWLVVVTLRTLPLPYGVWAAVLVLLGTCSTEAQSLPRYLAATFPLAVVLAARSPAGWRWRLLLVVLTALSGLLTAAWFADLVVP